MEKGLGKFCRDVDKLTKELWRADHFKVDVPREGDTLILIKGKQVVKIVVVDVVKSTVDYTGVVTARVIASPPFTGKDGLVGEILSGAYADGESVWTDRKGKRYEDYRLFIKDMAKKKPLYHLTGRLRKVVKVNNGSLNIALAGPNDPNLFKQMCTLRDSLRWSKPKRHYLSVCTTLFNASLALMALMHNQSVAALLMSACSLICFGCLHVELRRMKSSREEFNEHKAKLDKQYLDLKQEILSTSLDERLRTLLQMTLCSYHVLIMGHIHTHFAGLATSWAGQLHNAIETMEPTELFYYIDQYRESLDIPD